MPVINLIITLPQQIADHILARSLGTSGGGNSDQLTCGGKLRVETIVDGIENSLFLIERVH
jgi:hypothetical protein